MLADILSTIINVAATVFTGLSQEAQQFAEQSFSIANASDPFYDAAQSGINEEAIIPIGGFPGVDIQPQIRPGGGTNDPSDVMSLSSLSSSDDYAVSAAAAAANYTKDGTCGKQYWNTVCGNWYLGSCCSEYGFCGNTISHCNGNCQSGPCTRKPNIPRGASNAPNAANRGSFQIVGQSGVSAMHAAVMQNDKIIFIDKVEPQTQVKLPNGHYAYSTEYDPVKNIYIPLQLYTNPFCSGGVFLEDGRLLNIGGNVPSPYADNSIKNGINALRYISRVNTADTSSWSEPGNKLDSNRWYPSTQVMPNGQIFVCSGTLNDQTPNNIVNNNPTYEILDNKGMVVKRSTRMNILYENQPVYLYPFIHLLSTGNLFVFTARSSQIFNPFQGASGTVIKDLPDLEGLYRTYPNTGGSVMLPLSSKNGWKVSVMICGGGAYQYISSPTDPTCATMNVEDANPSWTIESMPENRTMVEGLLLPNGQVLWTNGAGKGAQGYGNKANTPTLEALLYNPALPVGQRFTKLASSAIPRLYHSVTLLLSDGRIMIAGSNPNSNPVNTASAKDPYITDYRVEIFTPPYLMNNPQRPVISYVTPTIQPGQVFTVNVNSPKTNTMRVVLYHGGFVTHSLHMMHRMLNLDFSGFKWYYTNNHLQVTAPPSNNQIPPGPYQIVVLIDGDVPSVAKWITITRK